MNYMRLSNGILDCVQSTRESLPFDVNEFPAIHQCWWVTYLLISQGSRKYG